MSTSTTVNFCDTEAERFVARLAGRTVLDGVSESNFAVLSVNAGLLCGSFFLGRAVKRSARKSAPNSKLAQMPTLTEMLGIDKKLGLAVNQDGDNASGVNV